MTQKFCMDRKSDSWNSYLLWGKGSDGSVVQCLARDLKVANSILAHGSFLVRGIALSH